MQTYAYLLFAIPMQMWGHKFIVILSYFYGLLLCSWALSRGDGRIVSDNPGHNSDGVGIVDGFQDF